MRVTGPPGTEYVQAIATSKPINIDRFVKDPDQAFPVIPDPQQLTQKFNKEKAEVKLKIQIGGEDAGVQFKLVPVKWNADWTSFQVGQPPRVNKSPQARFSVSSSRPQVGERVVFDASSSRDPDGRVVSYNWDFNGDGRIDARGRRVAASFSSSGSRRVKLTVKDNDGATDSTARLIRVSARGPRFGTATPVSLNSNGRPRGDWWKLRRNDYARWTFDSIGEVNQAFLNFKMESTTPAGGSGYEARIKVRILDRWGNVKESGTVTLNNPFRPRFQGEQEVGQEAYATYRIRNTGLLRSRFRVKIRLVQSNRMLVVRNSSVVIGYKVS